MTDRTPEQLRAWLRNDLAYKSPEQLQPPRHYGNIYAAVIVLAVLAVTVSALCGMR